MNVSSAEYALAIKILDETSQHRENILKVFKQIRNQLNGFESFLDVGVGDCVISNNVSKYFQNATIVEPVQEFSKNFQHPHPVVLNDSILTVDLIQSYDFIMCSHMLYGLTRSEVYDIIGKLYRSLQIGGTMFIALIAPRNQSHEFHRLFNQDYLNSSYIEECLKCYKIPFTKYDMVNTFKNDNYSAMVALCKFFIKEDCFLNIEGTSQEDVENIIAKFLCTCKVNNHYELTQEEELFVITKPYSN